MRKGMFVTLMLFAVWFVSVPNSSAALFDADTAVVSRTSGDSGPTADDMSEGGSVSDDGRFVAFSSRASNLGAPAFSAFVRDLATGEIRVVSKRGELTFRGDRPTLSGDGRYVVFLSNSTEVVDGVGDGNLRYVFRIKLADGSIELVSRQSGQDGNPLPVTDVSGRSISISNDGSRVGFSAWSGATLQTYVRDIETATLHLASSATGSSDEADGHAEIRDMSDDGRFVIISSLATNLAAGATGLAYVSYLRDTELETTVSLKSSTPGHCPNPGFRSLSATGRFATFNCREDGSTLSAFKFDFATNLVTPAVRIQGQEVSADLISDDGRYLVLHAAGPPLGIAGTFPDHSQVFLRDTSTGTNALVSRASGISGAPGTDSSFVQSITPDASLVVFTSSAQNLGATTGPTANSPTPSQVFARRIAGNPRPQDPQQPPPPTSPSSPFEIGFPKIARAGRVVALNVLCNRPDGCRLRVVASIEGKRVRTKHLKFTKTANPGASKIQVKLSKAITKKVRAALKKRTKLKLNLVVSSADGQFVKQKRIALK